MSNFKKNFFSTPKYCDVLTFFFKKELFFMCFFCTWTWRFEGYYSVKKRPFKPPNQMKSPDGIHRRKEKISVSLITGEAMIFQEMRLHICSFLYVIIEQSVFSAKIRATQYTRYQKTIWKLVEILLVLIIFYKITLNLFCD